MFMALDVPIDIAIDIVGIVLATGLMLYAIKMAKSFKGGILERGMKLLALSPTFFILSILTDALFESGFGYGFDIIHDLLLVVFILYAFAVFRFIVVSWRKSVGT
jgi:hypothetical protein